MEREPRVTRLRADHDEPVVRPSFDRFIRRRGKVPNLFRVAAHRPSIEATLADHMDAVMEPGEVSTLLKELLACRVSTINACEY